ncbi:MAG: HDOD domain-containing protein [Alphaproteobacteria bacterium]|nr:HDOD domain-containing protein [Alphaproteobacteria bacterium]
MIFYIARQPIFDRNTKLVAYELLFRDGLENAFPNIDPNEATERLVENSEFGSGIDALTANNRAFINFTEQAICSQLPEVLPKASIVVELLETVAPTDDVYQAVKTLKLKGYTLALDDFEYDARWARFMPYIDIIKMDFRLMSLSQIEQQMAAHAGFNGQYLAEKVESYDEFHQSIKLGFSYFQGYFFAKPEMIQRRSLSVSQKVYLDLLETVTAEFYDPDKIATIVERDTGVSYKLLRFVNSAFFARRSEITSLKQAVVRLGQQEIRKFVAIIATASLGQNKPSELTQLSVCRARFCENLAIKDSRYGAEPGAAFLSGLLSKLDALMDDELSHILSHIHASPMIRQALISKKGAIGFFLATAEAVECSRWLQIEQCANKLKLTSDDLFEIYQDAFIWASGVHQD